MKGANMDRHQVLAVCNIGVILQDMGFWRAERVLCHTPIFSVKTLPVPGGVEDQ